jgi:hypothetical protein
MSAMRAWRLEVEVVIISGSTSPGRLALNPIFEGTILVANSNLLEMKRETKGL